MAIAPKADIEKIRSSVNIVDLVSQYVTLKNAGIGAKKGLCPFHDEKTPSFTVKENTGTYRCFGCSEGGDIFAFVMKILGVDFVEALKILADRANVVINWEKGSYGNDNNSDNEVSRSIIIEINKKSLEYFNEQFLSDEASLARDELFKRNFTLEDCQQFSCGYAPKGWDNLVRFLASKGYTQKQLEAAGVISITQRNTVIDKFRGRLIWPIRDVMGDVIGFGARKIYEDEDKGPKYLNTPETRVYKKSKVLYALDMARKNIQEQRQCVIVEGYTDVMAMHLAGVKTAVATCGTAFGLEHVKVLNRLMGEEVLTSKLKTSKGKVVLTFDGDNAGKKAALKSYDLNNEFTAQTFVISVPEKLDPCEYRKKYGDNRLKILVDNSIPMIQFALNTVIDEFDITTPEGTSGAANATKEILADIDDLIIRNKYIEMLSKKLGVDQKLLEPQEKPVHNLQRQEDGVINNYQDDEYHNPPVNSDYHYHEHIQSKHPPVEHAPNTSIHNSPKVKKLTKEMELIRIVLAVAIQYPHFLSSNLFQNIDMSLFDNQVVISIFNAISKLGVGSDMTVDSTIWVQKIKETLSLEDKKDVKLTTVDNLLNYKILVDSEDKITNYVNEQISMLEGMSIDIKLGNLNSESDSLNPDDSRRKELGEQIKRLQKRKNSLRKTP